MGGRPRCLRRLRGPHEGDRAPVRDGSAPPPPHLRDPAGQEDRRRDLHPAGARARPPRIGLGRVPHGRGVLPVRRAARLPRVRHRGNGGGAAGRGVLDPEPRAHARHAVGGTARRRSRGAAALRQAARRGHPQRRRQLPVQDQVPAADLFGVPVPTPGCRPRASARSPPDDGRPLPSERSGLPSRADVPTGRRSPSIPWSSAGSTSRSAAGCSSPT